MQFRLADAAALVAVAGVALALTRSYLRCLGVLSYVASTELGNVRVLGVREGIYACVPTLVLFSAALWPLRLARAQRRSSKTEPLPGLAVSYVACAALAFALLRSLLDMTTYLRITYFPGVGVLTLADVLALRVVASKDMIGAGVAVTWLILSIGGGWRAERSWLERFGRLLGVFWVGLAVALWLDYVVRG